MNLRLKIIATTSTIVVILGVLTVAAINTIVANTLRRELIANGLSLAQVTGEAVANALLDGDLLAVQETLDNLKATRPDIVYAYAFGPNNPVVVHTFVDGFPRDLLTINSIPEGELFQGQRLITETGPIRDIGLRPIDGLNAQLHIGLSETGIQATLHQATWIIALITLGGMITGVLASIAFGRFVTKPLVRLTAGVKRLGEGRLDETIPEGGQDEIGALSRAFNKMAKDLSSGIGRLQESEAGHRALIEAASQVGEAIALIRDEGDKKGTFLFVNDEFSRLTGYPREQLLNLNAAEVIHAQSLDEVHAAWKAIHNHQDSTLQHEMTLFTRDGRKVIVETSGTLIEYDECPALVWYMRDITERKAREIEIHQRNRELSALNAVSAVMSGPGDMDQMLQQALEQALAALELPAGWVYITDHGNEKPRLAAMSGVEQATDQVEMQLPVCDCSAILHTAQPRVVRSKLGCIAWGKRTISGQPIDCHGSVPLIASGRVIGVLSAAATSPKCFDEDNFQLLVMVGRQMGIALENNRLWKELKEKERLRAELFARAIQAQEDERRRIARELHDETGQSLNALIFGLKAADTALATDSVQTTQIISRLKSAASDAVRELQNVIYDLRPNLLDDLGFIPALRWFAESRLESKGVIVHWNISGFERRLPSENETAIFRVAQEALTNIARYAQSNKVEINLTFEENQVDLVIRDDGIGFEVENIFMHHKEDGRGLGLLGMRERAELLGGQFDVQSSPGWGTAVHVKIPVTPNWDAVR